MGEAFRNQGRTSASAHLCLGYKANNARGETPCQIALRIKEMCRLGSCVRGLPFVAVDSSDVVAVAPETNLLFDPPTATSQNSCTCSGDYYLLVAACASCLGMRHRTWSNWEEQCANPRLEG